MKKIIWLLFATTIASIGQLSAQTNTFPSTGSVGIGTTTPVTMLDVDGSFHTANNTQLAPPSTGLGGLTVLWNRSGGQAEVNFYNVYDNAPISYIFSQKTGASAYNDLMYLWGNGNVGIGTINNGSNKLAVEGTIGARKVVVTATNPFPDYVFDRGYVLPSLRSLSSYIRVHHHLPELPSADSVARGGLDLGGNQTVLVKKIEELTLYIIGQDRELQELKKRMTA